MKFINFKEEQQPSASDKIVEELKAQGNIYAHVTVPRTNIDYPIAQHPTDDTFYLHHDFDDNETVYGAVFTERINAKDFNDLVTIVYGHATRDGSMFGTLDNFADKNFFDQNKTITIQTRQELITYEVFAAYSYTDEHLFDTYELGKKNFVTSYLNKIKGISDELGGNYRESVINTENKILILSTCDAEDGGRRFVVHAVERKRVSI